MLARAVLITVCSVVLGGCTTRVVGVRRPYADPVGTVPRMVFLPEVANFRDIGGWRGLDGRPVRQGMVYRSGCLNANWKWYRMGAARDFLSDETRRFLVEELGIRTDIDLRKEANCRGMEASALGPSVKFVNVSSKAYDDMASPEGRNAFRRVSASSFGPTVIPFSFTAWGGTTGRGQLRSS